MSEDDNLELAEALLRQENPLLSAIRLVGDSVEIQTPRWEYWRQIGAIQLWQAILLSCDQDPEWRTSDERYTCRPDVIWCALGSRSNEDVATRLDIATSQLGIDLPIVALNAEKLARSTIELSKFVSWAKGLGWSLPAALGEIAPANDPADTNAGAKNETPEQRRERLIKRQNELKNSGEKAFQKVVATEEGISVARLKQLTKINKTHKSNWTGLVVTTKGKTNR